MSRWMRTLVSAVLGCALLFAPVSSQGNPVVAARASGGIQLSGVVVDEDGRPVTGAMVILDSERSLRTDGEGAFLFSGVELGSHQISAVTEDCAVAQGAFQLEPVGDAVLRLEVLRQQDTWTPPAGSAVLTLEPRDLRAMRRARTLLDVMESVAPDLMEREGQRAGDGIAQRRALRTALLVDGVRIARNRGALLRGIWTEDVRRIDIVRLVPDPDRPRGVEAFVRISTRDAQRTLPCTPSLEGVSPR